MKKKIRIAIVYDWIDKWGGVERVLLNLHEMYPQATFFTSYFDKEGAQWAKNLKIRTSFIQKLPNFIKKNRILSLILYPYAFEGFKFNNYDLVISVTSSFAKSVITQSTHVCYMLTPTRYFYFPETYLTTRLTKLGYLLLPKLREWDFTAAQRPDYLLSISQTVQKRVQKYYQRNSEIIYPPFDLKHWSSVEKKIKKPSFKTPDDFYLVVSRLEPYKKVGIVVDAFNQSEENLIIVGKGSQLATLKNKAKENVTFVSDISDAELVWFYKNARALIMPQEEEFGYVALEAQYFACPVISFKKGGVAETVVDRKTGIFFDKQTPKAIREAVARFQSIEYNLKSKTRRYAKENLKRFDKAIFEQKFKQFIQSKINL